MATIGSLLRDRVTLETRSVDRIFLHAYVPGLQTMGQVIRFLLHRGYPIPSPAALGKIGKALVSDIERFCEQQGIPRVRFAKGEAKEEVAAPYLARAEREGREGVVLCGVAQEKAMVWRGWKQGGRPEHPHFEYRRQAVFVNHYYFYVYDRNFGPAFFKLCPYAPYSIWIWANGHEWAKRQAARAGISYTALDNGFASCSDPRGLQRICDRLSASHIRMFCLRWLRRLPTPFSAADREAGFFYEFAVRQLELSDTRVFDRPASGRAWFEAAIREHLDLGRPDQVSLVFDRRINRRTPGRFRTRVITRGVDPAIQIHYRASKAKQYFKEGRALRTETTVNDTRDFGVGRLLRQENFRTLRAAGEGVNRRLVELELSSQSCAPDADTLARVVLPSREDGLPAPALRFGDPRVAALLAALCSFTHLVGGFTNAGLRTLVGSLLGRPYSARQMTYDLRRLRRKGFIVRDEGTHRYRFTPHGRSLAMFFSKLSARVVLPSLPHLDPSLPEHLARSAPLGHAWRSLDAVIDDLVAASALAA